MAAKKGKTARGAHISDQNLSSAVEFQKDPLQAFFVLVPQNSQCLVDIFEAKFTHSEAAGPDDEGVIAAANRADLSMIRFQAAGSELVEIPAAFGISGTANGADRFRRSGGKGWIRFLLAHKILNRAATWKGRRAMAACRRMRAPQLGILKVCHADFQTTVPSLDCQRRFPYIPFEILMNLVAVMKVCSSTVDDLRMPRHLFFGTVRLQMGAHQSAGRAALGEGSIRRPGSCRVAGFGRLICG